MPGLIREKMRGPVTVEKASPGFVPFPQSRLVQLRYRTAVLACG